MNVKRIRCDRRGIEQGNYEQRVDANICTQAMQRYLQPEQIQKCFKKQ